MQVIQESERAGGRRVLVSCGASLLTGAVAFAACAPLLVVEVWAGVLVFGLLATVAVLLAWNGKQAFGHRAAYPVGLVAGAMLLAPLALNAELRAFFEAGFDDGPFHGRPFLGNVEALEPSHTIAFRSGVLVVFNRMEDEPPVLAYVVDGASNWALELDVSAESRYRWMQFWRVSEPLSLSPGILRDRLEFEAHWTFGAERGYVYVWKFGGVQRFYLSW